MQASLHVVELPVLNRQLLLIVYWKFNWLEDALSYCQASSNSLVKHSYLFELPPPSTPIPLCPLPVSIWNHVRHQVYTTLLKLKQQLLTLRGQGNMEFTRRYNNTGRTETHREKRETEF